MADGLLCTEDATVENVIGKTLVKTCDNSGVPEPVDTVNGAGLIAVQFPYSNGDSVQIFEKLCRRADDSSSTTNGASGGDRNNRQQQRQHDDGLLDIAEIRMPCSPATEEDCRKKRCVDRYDSSESSDSGVAVLSCTDCSGSSTASSDIADPGSPYSTASNHSEEGGGTVTPTPSATPPTSTATPTPPPPPAVQPQQTISSITPTQPNVQQQQPQLHPSPAHHPAWHWAEDSSPSLKRPPPNSNTLLQASPVPIILVDGYSPSNNAAVNHSRCLTEDVAANVNNNNNSKMVNSEAFLKTMVANKAKMQQGKITEYFKSHHKPKEFLTTLVDSIKREKKITRSIPPVLATRSIPPPGKVAIEKLVKPRKTPTVSTPRKILPAPSKPPAANPLTADNNMVNNLTNITNLNMSTSPFPQTTMTLTTLTFGKPPETVFVPQFANIIPHHHHGHHHHHQHISNYIKINVPIVKLNTMVSMEGAPTMLRTSPKSASTTTTTTTTIGGQHVDVVGSRSSGSSMVSSSAGLPLSGSPVSASATTSANFGRNPSSSSIVCSSKSNTCETISAPLAVIPSAMMCAATPTPPAAPHVTTAPPPPPSISTRSDNSSKASVKQPKQAMSTHTSAKELSSSSNSSTIRSPPASVVPIQTPTSCSSNLSTPLVPTMIPSAQQMVPSTTISPMTPLPSIDRIIPSSTTVLSSNIPTKPIIQIPKPSQTLSSTPAKSSISALMEKKRTLASKNSIKNKSKLAKETKSISVQTSAIKTPTTLLEQNRYFLTSPNASPSKPTIVPSAAKPSHVARKRLLQTGKLKTNNVSKETTMKSTPTCFDPNRLLETISNQTSTNPNSIAEDCEQNRSLILKCNPVQATLEQSSTMDEHRSVLASSPVDSDSGVSSSSLATDIVSLSSEITCATSPLTTSEASTALSSLPIHITSVKSHVLTCTTTDVYNQNGNGNATLCTDNKDDISSDCLSTESTSRSSSNDSHLNKSLLDDLKCELSVITTCLTSPVVQCCQKSPILSVPKTIRFPAAVGTVTSSLAQQKHQQLQVKKRKSTSEQVASGLEKRQLVSSEGVPCHWKECHALFETSGGLLEHLQISHVIAQASGEQYVCLWGGCKVHGRSSCSRSWLERHVLAHAGGKPFRCIVDGCGMRFNSQLTLQRHVNGHFNGDNTQNGTSKKSLENNSLKLYKRNGKKIRFRRQPWSARMFDFIDASIMEGLQYQLVQMTEKRTMGQFESNVGNSATLQAQVIARRVEPDGVRRLLVRYHPNNILPDEWIKESEYTTTKTVSIPVLPSDAKTSLQHSLFATDNDRARQRKHRRKPVAVKPT